jgi:hypothetical protein
MICEDHPSRIFPKEVEQHIAEAQLYCFGGGISTDLHMQLATIAKSIHCQFPPFSQSVRPLPK